MEASLNEDLQAGVRTCVLTGKPFIARHYIHTTITLESVKAAFLPDLWDDALATQIDQAKQVIALLVYQDREDRIVSLLADGLTDDDLPLARVSNSKSLQSRHGVKTFSYFAGLRPAGRNNFLRQQWLVLAPVLDLTAREPVHIHLDPDCALPFDCSEIGSTNFSIVYKATLQPGHGGSDAQKDTLPIAAKKFFNQEGFERERDNLDAAWKLNCPHIIRHLAVCKQALCIFFPWADGGSLDDFWAAAGSPRPADPSLVLWSLEQMAGLAHGLERLHSVNCRHGDLKPGNILHFSASTGTDPRGTLCIADLGIARIHTHPTMLRHGPTITKASTRAYEGPEASILSPAERARSRTYDSWSFGCILLEFAVWLLYGLDALTRFQNSRSGSEKAFYTYIQVPNASTAERHPAVVTAIAALRDDPRCHDTVLARLLDIVDNDLLQIEAAERATAADLRQHLEKLVQQARDGELELIRTVDPVPPTPAVFAS